MAEVLPGGLPPRIRVEWERFADGRPWRLVGGVDFTQTARQAQKAFSSWCRYQGYRGRSTIERDGSLVVQVIKDVADQGTQETKEN